MADAAQIVARVRAMGANVVVDAGRLQLVNAGKLPPEAIAFIKANGKAIADFLSDEQDAFEERAAIIEFEGRVPREWAEQFADLLIAKRPAGIDDLEWTWFLTTCGRIIDEAPNRGAAA